MTNKGLQHPDTYKGGRKLVNTTNPTVKGRTVTPRQQANTSRKVTTRNEVGTGHKPGKGPKVDLR